jgi:alkanesulfonate monooxygenase
MMKLHWSLPSFTDGDCRHLAPDPDRDDYRPATFGYLTEVARAADLVGFDAMLLPTGSTCEDAWVLAAALIPLTERLKFLVAVRPGIMSPTLAAQMVATFQRVSGDRLALNIVSGSADVEQRRYGDFLDKAERYERTAEFVEVLRRACGEEPFDFSGEHITVEGATTHTPPAVFPDLYFGGSSKTAEPVAATQTDCWLTHADKPDVVRERVERMKGLAAEAGRSLRIGISVVIVTRDYAEDAWAAIDHALSRVSPDKLEEIQSIVRLNDSENHSQMAALRDQNADLVVSPNLWAGVGLLRGGAGTALVGSHQEVADRLAEYHALGVDEFILHGYPHLEEAYSIGYGVMPILRREGLLAELPPVAAPAFRRNAAGVLNTGPRTPSGVAHA